MKSRYRPAFNARVYGPAEHRADIYWQKRLKQGENSGQIDRKTKKFCDEYLIDLNATQAAIRTGFSVKRASEIGYQLLQKTTVKHAIDKAMAERSHRR